MNEEEEQRKKMFTVKMKGEVRTDDHYVGRRAMEMKVQGRRKTGRPKRRWLYRVRDDIKEKGLSVEEVYDRATWRRMSSYVDPRQKWNKMKRKKNMKEGLAKERKIGRCYAI